MKGPNPCPGQWSTAAVFFVLSAVVAGFSACDDDSEEPASSDMLTSATPRVESVLLTADDPCWLKTDCKSCHDTMHTGNYRNGGECAYCHGPNGAPSLKTEHAGEPHPGKGCLDCHADTHAGDDFAENDCRGCHSYETPADGACTHTEDYDVIVVGAGGGGLAAATTLAMAGKNVLVAEQSYKTGGEMVNFMRGDYRFEASLHATDGLTMPSVLAALGVDGTVVLDKSDVMYQLSLPDRTLDIPADPEAYRALLKQEFPDEAADIDALFDAMAAVVTSMDFSPFYDMTVSQMLANFGITDEKLIAIFCTLCSFLAGGPDELPAGLFVGMWNAYHSSGYLYPHGGSQAITDAVTDQFLANGGTLKLHTLVTEIVVENGLATGIRTDEGGCYNAPYVISNVNIPDTYNKLIKAGNLPEETLAAVNARKPAPSNTMLYLGVDKDYSDQFPSNTHEIFAFLNYDISAFNMEDTVCDPANQGLAITDYTMLDPDSAPPGKNVIVISSVVGYDCYEQWGWNDSYDKYNETKRMFADLYLPRLEEFLPDILSHIEVMEVATPETIEAYTLNPRGSWEGFDDIPVDQGNNPMNWLAEANHKTPIPNLFVTGQWATEGAQSLVLNSGTIAAKLVLEAMGAE